MRWESFRYDRKFAAIVMTCGTFMLIEDFPKAGAVLRRFHDHLEPGGRLILDISPDDCFTSDLAIRSWMTPEGDTLTLQEHKTELDYVMQRTATPLRYELWRGGTLVRSEMEAFVMRWWGMHEMAMALTAAGFAPPVISGGFEHGRAPRTGDNVISFEATRP